MDEIEGFKDIRIRAIWTLHSLSCLALRGKNLKKRIMNRVNTICGIFSFSVFSTAYFTVHPILKTSPSTAKYNEYYVKKLSIHSAKIGSFEQIVS